MPMCCTERDARGSGCVLYQEHEDAVLFEACTGQLCQSCFILKNIAATR
eukprot:COSAG02_NODE_27744_length_603_cov_1.164683_2_plen_48_part_01